MIYNFKIFEALLKKDKKEQLFNYSSIIQDEWIKLISKAKEFQHITFDLENCDDIEKRTLLVTKKLRKDQPVKYEINVCLCSAGGDWEYPVLFFKIEFKHQYGIYLKGGPYIWDQEQDNKNRLTSCFVLIPGPDINNLVKTDKGYTAYTEDTIKDFNIDKKNWNKENIKKSWKWIENLLTELIDDRHTMLD